MTYCNILLNHWMLHACYNMNIYEHTVLNPLESAQNEPTKHLPFWAQEMDPLAPPRKPFEMLLD